MNQTTKDRQNKAIQIHLTVFGHINSWEAIRLYDITRLSARIWDLRNQYGMKIETKPTVVETKWGKTTVADYVLKEAQA